MEFRTCKSCGRCLPLAIYKSAGRNCKLHRCPPCLNDMRRLSTPLRPVPVDAAQVRINNTFNLWHGPVSPVPLRNAA